MAQWRWWDGAQWTSHWSGGATAPGSAVTAVELQRAHLKEQRTYRWARWSLVAVLIVLAGQWFGAFWMSHTFRHVWNFQVNNTGSSSQNLQLSGFSPVDGLYLDVFYVAGIAVAIVFLIWQHSAATVARGLGYPSRTSPGFGVGSWFIPVINLWMPYWALADTLPADHPMRNRCLWAWLTYIAAYATAGATFLVALASTAAAVVMVAISGVLALFAIVVGGQLVAVVNNDHSNRLGPA